MLEEDVVLDFLVREAVIVCQFRNQFLDISVLLEVFIAALFFGGIDFKESLPKELSLLRLLDLLHHLNKLLVLRRGSLAFLRLFSAPGRSRLPPWYKRPQVFAAVRLEGVHTLFKLQSNKLAAKEDFPTDDSAGRLTDLDT